MDLRAIQASPAKFRDVLNIDADGATRPLGTMLDDWQRQDFAALDPGWQAVAGLPTPDDVKLRSWLERPRGHSKTSDVAAMCSWVLFASRRSLRGVVAAASRDQAALLKDALSKLCRANTWLGSILELQTNKVINRRTGSEMSIISADAATSYGLLPDFVVLDEVTHWAGRDLFDSLLSASAKRSKCLLIAITNAGFHGSWQHVVREAIRTDPDWLFRRLEGPVASWITPARLAEQRRLLPNISYRRLWLNEWGSGTGDALAEDDINTALTQSHALLQPEPGWTYAAGVDLGLSRDCAAVALVGIHCGHSTEVAAPPRVLSNTQRAMVDAGLLELPPEEASYEHHPGTRRLRLAKLKVWVPAEQAGGKVDIEEIEVVLREWHRRFNIVKVGCDPWQCEYLIQRLSKVGIQTKGVDPTAGNLRSMCSAVLEAFTEQNIDLFPSPRLMTDLRNLKVVEKSYGVRLDSPRGPSGHGDSATALSIALHLLRNSGISIALNDPSRRLICN